MFNIAYCTNVHAGADFEQTQSHLARYSCTVKQHFSPDAPMGVGLWLSAKTAQELIAEDEIAEFRAWLNEKGLVPFTLNGFPYGDFHQKTVKHAVYQPTWLAPDRLAYTQDLVRLLDALAPAGVEGTISTLPIAWGSPPISSDEAAAAATQMRQLVDQLVRLESETGRCVSLCIEPEPGCAISTSTDIVQFFETHLLAHGDESATRRHLRVCHDICHAAVMCESQRDVLERYQAAGIEVGKVQVSSAVTVDFNAIDAADRIAAIQQLTEFAEDRYLHQTTIQHIGGDEPAFFQDLPEALATVGAPKQATGVWRIHFHVPIFLNEFGWLKASQTDIVECIECCRNYSNVAHFEVETYAWNVLPEELRQIELADGIAKEMRWFADLAERHLD